MSDRQGRVASLDDLDRRIVVALQADGRASWTVIAGACGTSVATVARRGRQLLDNRLVRVAVLPEQHKGVAQLFVLRITCAPSSRADVVARLAERRDLRFLGTVAGRTDIVAEISVGPEESVEAVLVDQVQSVPGVVHCEADLTVHVFKTSHEWSRQLLARTEPVPPFHWHRCGLGPFDPVDQRIVDLMGQDGRASFRSVAESVGLDESTVRRRFDALCRAGCVRVVTLVPPQALGFATEVILDVTVAPSALSRVAEQLCRRPEVRYLAAMLGRNALLCVVNVSGAVDAHHFTAGTLAELDGVQGWSADLVLDSVRRNFVDTPWSYAAALGGAPSSTESDNRGPFLSPGGAEDGD